MSIPVNVVKILWDNIMEAMSLLRGITRCSFSLITLPLYTTRDLVAGLMNTIFQSLNAIMSIVGRKKITTSDAKAYPKDEKSNFD